MKNIDLNSMSATQLVTHALVLGLTAPSDELMRHCADIAESFAVSLTTDKLEACKAAALRIAEGSIGGMRG